MKRIIAFVLAVMMTAVLLAGCGGGKEQRVVNVCSWGEYIDESLIGEFESQTGIHVNYQTAESNETLYSLLQTGGARFMNESQEYDNGALRLHDRAAYRRGDAGGAGLQRHPQL